MLEPQQIVSSDAAGAAGTDTREQALRLLRAVSAEMAALSQDIVRLGEALSDEMVAIKKTGRMHDLQSFDLIAQSAQSHAELLHKLIDAMSETDECEPSFLASLIDLIPFHGVRDRLTAALEGRASHRDEPELPGDDADWF